MLHSAHRYEGSFSVFFFIYVYYRIKVSIVEKVEKLIYFYWRLNSIRCAYVRNNLSNKIFWVLEKLENIARYFRKLASTPTIFITV